MEVIEETFGDAAFDCYAWLEEAVIDRGGDVAQLAPLVPQLSLLSQSLTKSIHQTLRQVAVAGPHVQAQLDGLHKTILPLSQQLDAAVSAEPAAEASAPVRGKNDADRDLQLLLTLHQTKSRLQSCSKALVEAARWEKNVRACVALMESPMDAAREAGSDPNSPALAARVSEMRASLEILKEMPGADDRRRTMEGLFLEIERALKPRLDEFLQEVPVSPRHICSCHQILKSIGREQYVIQAYSKSRPAQIHRMWYSYVSADGSGVAQWLESWYTEVARMIQRESGNCKEIFGSGALDVLTLVVQNALGGLKESFRDRLRKEFSMETLVRAFQISCRFAGEVMKAFRDSESRTLSAENTKETEIASVIVESVFAPYQTFFINYVQHATESLSTLMIDRAPEFAGKPGDQSRGHDAADIGEDAVERYTQRLEDASKDIWNAVDEAIKLCFEFTAGAAFPESVRAIAASTQALSSSLVAVIPSIRREIGIERERRSSYPTEADKAAAQNHSILMPEWRRFHSALTLLRTCGTLLGDLHTTDHRARVRMREQLQGFVETSLRSSPSCNHTDIKSISPSLSFSIFTDSSRLARTVTATWMKEDADRGKQLAAFIQDLDDMMTVQEPSGASTTVLASSELALTSYCREVQRLTYDSIFSPISVVMASVATNECWTQSSDASLGDLPSFSTLPQEYITSVADLLLSLLPQLEPFAESSSLPKAALASSELHTVCSPEWANFGSILRLSSSEVETCENIFVVEGPPSEDPAARATMTASRFVDIWTGVLASGTTAAFLAAVCAIPALSDLGTKQLEADVRYFENVLNALSGAGEGNFLMKGLRSALEMPTSQYAEYVEQLRAALITTDRADISPQHRVLLSFHENLLEKRQHGA